MLTKLLVTILVAVIGWKVISKRQATSRVESVNALPTIGRKTTVAAAILLLVAVAVIGWQWWDGFQQVQVTIVSPQNGNVETYSVRKRDIGENTIVTVEGLKIRLSKDERIEIAP
ncbi:hypothetical protein [Shewanella mangrovi]|uniref:hypothetical protein n=1 Tax=Shewanella mangrovi TaxID=1515746 RepID=UPI00068F4D71|nr:hypothetical protein [Shewanella mangrovi]